MEAVIVLVATVWYLLYCWEGAWIQIATLVALVSAVVAVTACVAVAVRNGKTG